MAHKFKVGDRVRVIDKPPEDRKQYPSFPTDMDGQCGRESIIESEQDAGGLVIYRLKGIWQIFRSEWLVPIELDSMTPAQLRAEADRIEAEEKRKAEREAKLSALTPAQRAAVDMLKAKPSAFGCNRADVIALASALCGVHLAPLVADG